MQNTSDDPLNKVDPQLRPHLHLVSSFKVENKGDPFRLGSEQICDLLKDAASENSGAGLPWCWKKLDAPRDRTAMIVWQSPQLKHFPTDGYLWADPEETHIETLDGFKLESQRHRSGMIAGLEQYTMHARTRYRLTPASPGQGQQGCDPCLWLVLYHRAERDRILPFSRIPSINMEPQKRTLAQRTLIFQGDRNIKQKPFVWKDKSNWPTIEPPPSPVGYVGQAPNMIGRGQQGPYMGGQQIIDPRTGQPSAKRLKQAAGMPLPVFPEGEDDLGKGDIMDVLTPRMISRVRYRQHTEWMDQILNMACPVQMIHPVGLGLGRTGELAHLSEGVDFVDTPMDAGDSAHAKRIDAAGYDKYVKQANDKIAELRAEIEKEKARHEKRLAKIRQSNALQEAEQKLRSAVQFPHHAGSGSQSSRIEQRSNTATGAGPNEMDAENAMLRQLDEVNRIGRSVEETMGRAIKPVQLVSLVNKGGLEEKAPTPPRASNQPPTVPEMNLDGIDESMIEGLQGHSNLPDYGNGMPNAAHDGQNDQGIAEDTAMDMVGDDFEIVDKAEIPGGGDHMSDDLHQQGQTPSLQDDVNQTPGDFAADDFLNLGDDGMGDDGNGNVETSMFDDAFPDDGLDDQNAIDHAAQG